MSIHAFLVHVLCCMHIGVSMHVGMTVRIVVYIGVSVGVCCRLCGECCVHVVICMLLSARCECMPLSACC